MEVKAKKDGVNTSLAVAGAPEAPQLDLEGRAVCNALPQRNPGDLGDI